MSMLQAIMMGILQGLTEFLPVSSSGHLAIFQYIFNINTDTGLLFDVLLHLGTLVAVCIVYWRDFSRVVVAFVEMVIDLFYNLFVLISGGAKGQRSYRRIISNAYRKFVVMIIVTTIPTGIIGLLLDDCITKASQGLLVPGICLVITAIILLISDMKKPGNKKVKKSTYGDAAVVGVAQGFATLPGLSRSGTTITACLLLGFDRGFAVKYSFIASIPAILGANILELVRTDSAALASANIPAYIVGAIVAGIVGYICIKVMIRIVKSNKFHYFAYYCAAVGIIAVLVYFIHG
ncbi:MAG: undecaprenyl-diphosphate phosphatase [Lachnospiraceae bacterium]|jgi:undecaprenyl-diphosphatase